MRAIRNGLHGAGIPVENSKGEWGPGQEEINVRLRRGAGDGRPARHLKNGVKEIAHLQGKAVTFMAKWRHGPRRLLLPHPHVAVGRDRQDAAVPGRHGRAACRR